jgi:hypothetical protein
MNRQMREPVRGVAQSLPFLAAELVNEKILRIDFDGSERSGSYQY